MDTNVSIVNSFMESIVTIGERLRAERERLGLSQEDFAARAGAHRKSQGNYESGVRAPDATYLAAIAAAGADVLYIITGRREPQSAPAAGQESKLDPYLRRSIEMVMERLESRGERVSTKVFIKLVEDGARYLRQGAELERRMKSASTQEKGREKVPSKQRS